jgi:hypothetical protein
MAAHLAALIGQPMRCLLFLPKSAVTMQTDVDCLIIGGGPAGLTASVYFGRYRRNVAVFDSGESRARLIPESQNYPGLAEGILALHCSTG